MKTPLITVFSALTMLGFSSTLSGEEIKNISDCPNGKIFGCDISKFSAGRLQCLKITSESKGKSKSIKKILNVCSVKIEAAFLPPREFEDNEKTKLKPRGNKTQLRARFTLQPNEIFKHNNALLNTQIGVCKSPLQPQADDTLQGFSCVFQAIINQ